MRLDAGLHLLLCAAAMLSLASGQPAGQPAAEPSLAPTPAPAPAAAPTPVPAPSLGNGTANGTGAGQFKKPLVFCTANWEPIAMCKNSTLPNGTAGPYAPNDFSGHDVTMVRDAAAKLNWTEGVDFRFRCSPFSGMVASLLNDSGPCNAAVAGITITTEREASGIKFSYPYFKSSLSALVQAQQTSSSGWGFTRPFSWDLWLALLLTLVVVPPTIFAIEFLSLRKAIHRGDIAPGVVESTWRSAITLMLMDAFSVTSQGARVAVLCFSFLALLTTSTYTANLAAFVTVNSITSRISSINDLRGRAVGTSPIYIERLQKYGIQGSPFPFSNGSDYLVWRDLVISGQLAALVRDTPALQWLANTAPLCNVVVLPQQIEPFDYGVAFHSNTSEWIVDAFSSAILRLQEDGTLQQLRESWIVSTSGGCQDTAQVNKNAQPVSFMDLYGLWIILGVGLLLGGSIMMIQRWRRRKEKQQRDGDGARWGGPLPPERRPRRLASAVFGRRRSRNQRSKDAAAAAGSGDRSPDDGSQKSGKHGVAGPQASEAGDPPLFDGGQPVGDAVWDLESQPSLPVQPSQSSQDSQTQSARGPRPPAAGGRAVTPRPSEPQQGGQGGGSAERERRFSALQARESIYTHHAVAHEWKSVPKTSAQP